MLELTMLLGGERKVMALADGSYPIGRGAACRIRLDFPDVSERHAILTIRDDRAILEDLRSANGTYVNGDEIDSPVVLTPDMMVQIGDTLLRIAPPAEVEPHEPHVSAALAPSGETITPFAPAFEDAQEHSEDEEQENEDDSNLEIRRSVQRQIQTELLKRLDMKRLTLEGVGQEGLEEIARKKISEIVDEVVNRGKLPPFIDPDRLEEDVFNEAMRLGPLEELIADDTISEIMVNGSEKVYIERDGRVQLSSCRFTDDAGVMAAIERIVAPLGRRIDESQPYVDARLADGSRVNAIIPPLSLSGPIITIRKFSQKAFSVEDFIRFGTWTRDAAEFLRLCVRLRKNIIVSGGTGSGKTTLLNLLSSFIPRTERIVTIEDSAELRLAQPHVIRLESRAANIEGKGEVTIRDLVRNTLRMRPDRIIVGECRGGEALDMLQAMNTGHDGSLTTVHANSPRDTISRLETMVLMSGMDLPSKAIREQIASAVDMIVQVSRMADGTRKIAAISEVTGLEGTQIVMQDIFAFHQTGVGENGKILGSFKATGAIPTWFDQLPGRGIKLDPRIFSPDGI